MPRKDARKVTESFTSPTVEATEEGARITFDGFNTNGNRMRLTIEVYRCHIPHLIKEFVRIARESHAVTGGYLKKLQEAAL